MEVAKLLDRLEEQILETQKDIAKVNYEATEDDYEIVDGERVYTTEFLDSMPSNYATLLGRFGTLMEVKTQVEESVSKEFTEVFKVFNNSRMTKEL